MASPGPLAGPTRRARPAALARAETLARAVGALALLASLAACIGVPRTPVPESGPLTLRGNCSQADEDGFREQARLDVTEGKVRALDWKMYPLAAAALARRALSEEPRETLRSEENRT